MAIIFRLIDDSTTNEIDLVPGSGGFELSLDYMPAICNPQEAEGQDPPNVFEVLPVICRTANDNDMATKLQEAGKLARLATRYFSDTLYNNPVWLEVKLDNETNTRRSLVRSLKVEAQENWHFCASGDNVYWQSAIVVERLPYWEANESRTLPRFNPTETISVTYDYTAAGATVGAHDIVGDVGARIGYALITPRIGTTSELGRLWVGLRSAEKYGADALTNFVNKWECEVAGATLGTDAARAADATASPGGAGNTKVTVTPGTATWAKRLSIRLGDITANYEDNFGFFLWLLRMKVSAGTWQVQAHFGYKQMTDDEHVRGELIEVSSTSWNIYEMGFRIIPATNWQIFGSLGDSREQTFQIQIWAQRTDGAGTLDLDCLTPVPVDEGFFSVQNMSLSSTITANDQLRYGVSPRNDVQFKCSDLVATSGELKYPAYIFSNFYLPPGDGRMIVVHARDSTSVLGDDIGISGSITDSGIYYERFLTLRGGN